MRKSLLLAMLVPALQSFSQNVGIGTITPTDKLTVLQTDLNTAGSFEINNPASALPALTAKTNGTALNTKAVLGFRGSSTIIPGISTAILGENNDGAGIMGLSNTGPGAYAASMTNDGIYGLSIGGSAGVHGRNDNNGSYGVWGENFGTGVGVYGISSNGNAGKFLISNAANTNNALEGTTNGLGTGVVGSNTATTGITTGVTGSVSSDGSSSGTNNGVTGVLGIVSTTAAGVFSAGVRGVNNGTGNLGIGVAGYHAGSGVGVYGESPGGISVYGISTGGYGGYFSASTGTALGISGKLYANGSTGTIGSQLLVNASGLAYWQGAVAFSARDIGAANLSVASSTDVKLPFADEEFDLGNDFNTSSNAFIAPVKGVYHFDAFAFWQPHTNGVGYLALTIRVNNSIHSSTRLPAVSGKETSSVLTIDILLNAGDVVNMFAFQTSGVAQLVNQDNRLTRFSGHLVCRQ